MPKYWIPSPPPMPNWAISRRRLNGRRRRTSVLLRNLGREARNGSSSTRRRSRTGKLNDWIPIGTGGELRLTASEPYPPPNPILLGTVSARCPSLHIQRL